MPPHLIAHRSGVHRAACLALFRALIRAQKRPPLVEHQEPALYSAVKTTFKRNTKLDSPKKIVAALNLGYETLKTLRHVEIEPRKLTSILHDVVVTKSLTHDFNTSISAKGQPKPKAQPKPPRSPPRVWPHPQNIPVLSRPFFNLTGRRQVPKLVSANKIPFLRHTKPQSPFLSRIIRNKIDVRTKRVYRKASLTVLAELGREEDRWEDILHSVCKIRRVPKESSWAEESQNAWDRNQELHLIEKTRILEVTHKMQEIVEKEQALADKERMKRRDEKHKLKKMKRAREKVSAD